MTEKKCQNCEWWKRDMGIFTVTGWTGMGRGDGHCHHEVQRVYKHADDKCSHFSSDQPECKTPETKA